MFFKKIIKTTFFVIPKQLVCLKKPYKLIKIKDCHKSTYGREIAYLLKYFNRYYQLRYKNMGLQYLLMPRP